MFFFYRLWRIKEGYGSFQFGKQQHSKKTTIEQTRIDIFEFLSSFKCKFNFEYFVYFVYYVLIFHYNQVYMTTPDYKALHGETNYVLLINLIN